MGRILTKGLLIIVCVLFWMGIAGCSGNVAKETEEKEKAGQNPTPVPESEEKGENMYIPEYVILPEYAALERVHIGNDTVYFAASEYQEDGSLKYGVYRLKINETEPVMLDFQLDTDEKIQCMNTDKEGNLYFVTGNAIQSLVDETEKYIKLMKTDNSGIVINSFDITAYFSEQRFKQIDFIEIDGEGKVILNPSGSDSLIILDQKGNLLFKCRAGGTVMGACSSHGKIYVAYYAATGMEAAEVNMDAKGLGFKYEKIGKKIGSFYMTEAAGDRLLIDSGGIVYEYDLQTGEQYKLFDWFGCDIFGESVSGIKRLEDGRVFAVSRSYSMSLEGLVINPEFVFLRKVNEGEDPDSGKEILKVYIMSGIRDKIKYEAVRFNKLHAGYRIEVEIVDDSFFTEAVIILNADLISGKGPDIIVFPVTNSLYQYSGQQFLMETYAEKGLLENLYDYIDGDDTLKREDFIENIIGAFEINGKLCVIPLFFEVETMLGRASEVGNSMGWNLDQMIAYANGKGSGAEIFGWAILGGNVYNQSAKKTVLDVCIRANLDGLIGENGFDRELMIKILEFSNQMKNYKTPNSGPDQYSQIEEIYLLPNRQFNYPADYVGLNMRFKEPLTFIGYPTEEGTGSFAATSAAVGINANCKHKEIAWEFIRTFLTQEWQMGYWYYFGMPIRKDAMEGRYEEYIRHLMGDNDSLTVEEVEKQLETVTEMIAGIESVALDTPAHTIIREEADYYFNGVKTVEETADVIASRVMLYINENR